jgi:hypothetical protein
MVLVTFVPMTFVLLTFVPMTISIFFVIVGCGGNDNNFARCQCHETFFFVTDAVTKFGKSFVMQRFFKQVACLRVMQKER